MTKTITTHDRCAACRMPNLLITMPDPDRYPGAVAEAVCPDCPPLRPIELGVAALTDPTPAERAAAEAVWRPVSNPDEPCRCSGNGTGADGNVHLCSHGNTCDCGGRLIHTDRFAVGLISPPDYWMDTYCCTECTDSYDIETRLPDLPWGVRLQNEAGDFSGYELYHGVRHAQFNTDVDEEDE
jgi:hypothetical protein